ncbi:MAG: hypothetical protein IJN17_04040 [Clostridia bacterium]|nr:hypothetical protein [Clostridia bacterium]
MITIKKVYITNILPLLNEDVYQYYYDRIGEYRQNKANKLVSDIDKARSVGAGAVLRFAIEDSTNYNYDKLRFSIEKNGKPYVEDEPFYFSLSHSGDYAVCAISDAPIGVDIEQETELSEKFRKRFADSIVDWTKKEAKGKLTGNGFFDTTEDSFVYTHKKEDGYIITVCSDEKVTEFLYYHLPFPC